MVIHIFISSCLDCCNLLLTCLIKASLECLQLFRTLSDLFWETFSTLWCLKVLWINLYFTFLCPHIWICLSVEWIVTALSQISVLSRFFTVNHTEKEMDYDMISNTFIIYVQIWNCCCFIWIGWYTHEDQTDYSLIIIRLSLLFSSHKII